MLKIFASSVPHEVPGARERLATRGIFLIAALPTAAWAPLIPLVKERLGLNDGSLGLMLLCLGLGALLAMPITAALTSRIGLRRVITVAAAVALLVFPTLAVIDTLPAMAVALVVFGGAMGTLDVAMNLQAVVVERESKRPLMSGFHGMWSVGGIVGSGMMSFLLSCGISAVAASCIVSGAILLCLAFIVPGLLPLRASEGRAPLFVKPKGVIIYIGIMCFLTFLAEHSVLDWSAVFLTSQRGADVALAGLGYTVFAVLMTIGRLTGDRLRQALGEARVLLIGGIVGAVGLWIVVLAPSVPLNLLGFGLLGAGTSNIVPVLYSITGRTRVMPPNLALTAVAAVSYLGALAGPAAIGFLAHATDLGVSFVVLSFGLLLIAGSSKIANPRP